MTLFEKLTTYAQNGRIPMHMPGHKRNCDFFTVDEVEKIDITEIDGFDDYHYPEEILLESMEIATKIYGSRQTMYLVNGSSCGILAAISAIVSMGGTLLMARNCHKSVYHAALLRAVTPVYIYPETIPSMWINGVINPENVEKALSKNENIQAVIITSPTYEGVVSDITRIAQVVHKYNKILIVDEAHGAHFNFSDKFPKSSVKCGADIVIQSLHKTLPSYTQTAVIHVCTDRVDIDRLRKYLSIYQTSSPSYIFMAGMEKCINYMNREGKLRLEKYYSELMALREKISNIHGVKLLVKNNEMYDYDVSKLVISTNGRMTGVQMTEILRTKYNIEPEMTADDYIILMTSLCDDFAWYDIITEALSEIGMNVVMLETANELKKAPIICESDVRLNPAQAEALEIESVMLTGAVGRISAETAYVYPPGIPILMPGEEITLQIQALIMQHKECGLKIKGLKDKSTQMIECIM